MLSLNGKEMAFPHLWKNIPIIYSFCSSLTVRFSVNNHEGRSAMTTVKLVEIEEANAEVLDVYRDIMKTREIDWINNFWKALAVQPEMLRRTWEGVKTVMAPGALDPLTKEMIYIAVSATNSCQYCINSHTAAARNKGMTDEMLAELVAVVAMANQTNALASGLQVEVDRPFQDGGRKP
jgi:AhpD family alkylhydroperoxidase